MRPPASTTSRRRWSSGSGRNPWIAPATRAAPRMVSRNLIQNEVRSHPGARRLWRSLAPLTAWEESVIRSVPDLFGRLSRCPGAVDAAQLDLLSLDVPLEPVLGELPPESDELLLSDDFFESDEDESESFLAPAR